MTENNTSQQQAVSESQETQTAPQVKPAFTRPVSPELGKKTPYEGRNKKTAAVAIICIVIALIWAITMVTGSIATLKKINRSDEPLVISAEADGGDIALEEITESAQ